MIRLAVTAGLLIAAAVAVPMVYESNPDAVLRLFGGRRNAVQVTGAAADDGNTSGAPQNRRVLIPANRAGHYVASFKLNGRSVEAVIDTGASLVAINETTARRIGVSVKPADFRHQVQTANGQTAAAAATIRELQIGRIIARDVPAVVLNDKALSSTLIGVSFLQRLARWHVDGDGMVLEQ
ncbi:TIGR02281 family clan AA aspartic protease [Tianweitania sp. BSSL-BM11]|uniref:TIGR02281 family clan AA aspartic protease n=1 Tax=Tianweitania aestuarii TaxID=2814886 RepID=A0ABS5RPY9_9HYPH|nr:TIGR02281 family clan AA aspartic protease [Tianweitania aestuarii]MBS9719108.1 TIGR02281 family clan AA aspartic protease [Tianweitania aestuarii]